MVINIIKEVLLNKTKIISNFFKLEKWLNHFEESSSFDNKKLLVCLTIDILTGNLDLNRLDLIISKIDINKDPYLGFYDCINLNLAETVSNSNFNVCGCEGDTYVVVMKVSHLNLLHNNNNLTYTSINPAYNKAINSEWVDIECLHKYPKNSPQNRKDLFWVTPKKAIETLVNTSPNDHASEVVNQLAIYKDKEGIVISDKDVVYLEINDTFNEVCWQPTCIDGGDSELYISYIRDDHFGRTRSIDGKHPICLKERVFLGFDTPSVKFRMKEYNRGTPVLKKVSGNILIDSYKRLFMLIS